MSFHRPNWRTPYWTAETLTSFGTPFADLVRAPKPVPLAPPLVLGLAARYDAEQVAPFLLSLRKSGYDGDVALLTSDIGVQARALLTAFGVEAIAFDPADYAPYHLQNARWFGYLDYLMGRLRDGALPRRVLFTDVRDVVFQDDPFRGFDAGLDVFHENSGARLGQCAINSRWIRTCFGDHVARELAPFNITCSGTVMADGAHALRYLIEMWNVMALLSDTAATSIADQAAHNFIVHRGLVDGVRQRRNGDHVLTLHHVGKQDVTLEPDGGISTPDGRLCPIVHQYDRHPRLVAAVRERYPAPPERSRQMNAA